MQGQKPGRMRWWLWGIGTWVVSLVGCAGSAGECSQDTDCPAGRYCQAEVCAFDCTHDAQCPADFFCSPRGRCERGCRRTNNGVEACDEIDNDCDGQTDEDFAGLGDPCRFEPCPDGTWICAPDGLGLVCDGQAPLDDDSLCNDVDDDCDGQTDEDASPQPCPLQAGVCAGALTSCLIGGQWSECIYGPQYSQADDATCDGLDNDCDGLTDEDAEVLPIGEFGPQATDGLDNNCNGLVDEPGGVMVRLDEHVAIDAYEATVYSSPGCSGTRYGEFSDDYPPGFPVSGNPSISVYACSLPGVMPSGYLSWYRAGWACQAQGKRLCTASEYNQACRGPDLPRYPYGTAFFSGWCNDGWLAEGHKQPTGSFPVCVSSGSLYDMSGNLGEWTANGDPDHPGNALQGGGYYTCWICEPSGFCYSCDRGLASHKDEIMAILDCYPGSQAVGNNYDSFPKSQAPAFLGTRCCLDLD